MCIHLPPLTACNFSFSHFGQDLQSTPHRY
jgi:hypothetical protein